MNVYKVTVEIIDFDNLGPHGIQEIIENSQYLKRYISPVVRGIEGRDIGEWGDDHALNGAGNEAEFERLFKDPKGKCT